MAIISFSKKALDEYLDTFIYPDDVTSPNSVELNGDDFNQKQLKEIEESRE